jgi:16S rRNA (guanine966-N2)-methyltransferase
MIRLLAGSAGGRRLSVPAGSGTRPTSERAREGLFSTLASLTDLSGAAVLDLYAGSGAVGLEALSRGARSAVLVDNDPRAVRTLRANAAALALPGVQIYPVSVERWLASCVAGTEVTGKGEATDDPTGIEARGAFDIAFLDPPYALDITGALAALPAVLAPGAVVVVERATRGPQLPWPAGFQPVKARRYGEGTLWYGRRS